MFEQVDRRWLQARLTALACAGALPAGSGLAAAGNADAVILEVSGRVANSRFFTRSDLMALGVTTIETSTSWTTGVHRFEGVLARAVLAEMGPVGSTSVVARALNDYTASIPISDFENYDVIFAWSMDGVPLTRRDKGPLWIIYPRDAVPELADERLEHRWVWQMNRLLLP